MQLELDLNVTALPLPFPNPLRNNSRATRLLRLTRQLGKQQLLVLDEFRYVPASKAGAELLFDIISTAYERQSIA